MLRSSQVYPWWFSHRGHRRLQGLLKLKCSSVRTLRKSGAMCPYSAMAGCALLYTIRQDKVPQDLLRFDSGSSTVLHLAKEDEHHALCFRSSIQHTPTIVHPAGRLIIQVHYCQGNASFCPVTYLAFRHEDTGTRIHRQLHKSNRLITPSCGRAW